MNLGCWVRLPGFEVDQQTVLESYQRFEPRTTRPFADRPQVHVVKPKILDYKKNSSTIRCYFGILSTSSIIQLY